MKMHAAEAFSMRWGSKLPIAVMACFAMTATSAAEPRYKLNKQQTRVIEISGLSNTEDCHPFNMSGRVTDREFDGPRVTGVTIEDKTGERTFINVEAPTLETSDRVTIGWINQGLQQMLREGQRVSMRVAACGAAGRVMVLVRLRPQ